jgi:PleD family two-component response regulator
MIADVPFMTPPASVAVTASFGVASTAASGPDLGTGVEALIAAADTCLYRSKQNGRNRTTSIEFSGCEISRERLSPPRVAPRASERPRI